MFQGIRVGTDNTGIRTMVLVFQIRIVITDEQVGHGWVGFYNFQGFSKTAKDFMLYRKAMFPEKLFDGIQQGKGIGCYSGA